MINYSKENRITIRLDDNLQQKLEELHQHSKKDKSNLIRTILANYFTNNEEQLNKYYEKTKAN